MTTAISYFIKYTKDGKEVSAWLAVGRSPNEFENVTYTEERIMLMASEGKSLKLKTSEDILGTCIWMQEHTIDEYEEVDTPEHDKRQRRR